jgi:hypothetical protein
MEDDYFRVPTWTEVCREYAANAGGDRPEQAWILTPWDTWERNPAYSGVFADAPHPFISVEDFYDDDGGAQAPALEKPAEPDDCPF